MTSSVVLELPESYSKVIPSLAISAALSCASVASNTLSKDWYFDHAFVVSVMALFSESSESKKDFCFFNDDFLIEDVYEK